MDKLVTDIYDATLLIHIIVLFITVEIYFPSNSFFFEYLSQITYFQLINICYYYIIIYE